MEGSLEVGRPHLIVHDGEPVGIVAVASGPAERDLREGLERAGYSLEEPTQGPDGQERFELGGECEVERPRTCELEICLGLLEEIAEESGVSSEEIDRLASAPFTEAEAEEAARVVLGRLPDGDKKVEAETFVAVTFEGAGRDG